jgi:phosphate transport system permease protein
LYATLRWGAAGLFAAIVVGLIVSIVSQSSQAFAHSGISFLWSGTWNPDAGDYASGTLVVGTVITTLVAMIIVVPVGLGVSVSLSELMPRWLAAPLSTSIEFLAAVPSIVVGLWALLVLSPVFATDVEPALEGLPVLNRIFRGPAYGPSVLLASVVLAIMTLPTVVALSRTALATHWQVVRRTVLPGARSGIAAAITLAIGRALGESIAVALVIGNRPAIPHSLLAPGATLGSAIVNQFAEASPGLGTSAVIALAGVLLLLTILVNVVGQLLVRRRGGRRLLGVRGAVV